MVAETGHRTVMLQEAVDALSLREGSIVVDATGGGGGHSERIAGILGKEGTLIVIDNDADASERIRERLKDAAPTVHVVRQNFRALEEILAELGISEVDALLADLGWNSEQFAHGGRGFSFREDEPLTMTYGPVEEYPFTAADIVNEWSEEVIADVLYGYAEERYARRIAKEIVKRRPIKGSAELAEIVRAAVPFAYRRGRIHPATKTFQALRIAVNDELDALKELLAASTRVVREGGRIAIVSFHSIEDRIVKEFMRDMERTGIGTIITKKPIAPSAEEITENPRARSAKLRIFEIL